MGSGRGQVCVCVRVHTTPRCTTGICIAGFASNMADQQVLEPTSVTLHVAHVCSRPDGAERYSPARSAHSDRIVMAARHARTLPPPACHWTHTITVDGLSVCARVCVCVVPLGRTCCQAVQNFKCQRGSEPASLHLQPQRDISIF